ncbi:dynein regulatory complex subunit 4 isoform X2 [Mobula hypostoma]|uniref:dynein regulatory complex subunit 4 isoform X2 n=1 Tax=Mobula hypostoma TaxID=723540 RepID=UPI002FC3CCC3
MAPKKKKGKAGKKAKAPTVIDGISTEDMSKEQLEEHIVRLREELDREREERNYFQLERDKIHTFWEITKRQLEEKKSELRNKDREMEDAEERHQVEVKVYKQKVKHLLYEHQNNLAELKIENTVALKLGQKEHHDQERHLVNDMRNLKLELKEQELSNENMVKTLKLKNDEEITRLWSDFEKQTEDIEAKYQKKMDMLREEMELKRKTEIHEIEERKNSQINALMKNHEKAFSDIKNYYNDITLNNLALINSLKEQVEEMKTKEERMENEMADLRIQNKHLTEPLQKAREEVARLTKLLANYEQDKGFLTRARAKLKMLDKEMKQFRWEYEVLEQRFCKDVLDSKNNVIKDLQYELARVCKAHNDLLRTYESKLTAFGIPLEELGFKPLETALCGQTIGQGPAGLVASGT